MRISNADCCMSLGVAATLCGTVLRTFACQTENLIISAQHSLRGYIGVCPTRRPHIKYALQIALIAATRAEKPISLLLLNMQ